VEYVSYEKFQIFNTISKSISSRFKIKDDTERSETIVEFIWNVFEELHFFKIISSESVGKSVLDFILIETDPSAFDFWELGHAKVFQ